MSNWVRGEREPEDLHTLAKLAQALHVSVDWLLSMPAALPPARVPRGVDQRAVNSLIRHLRDAALAGEKVVASLSADDEETA